MAVDISESPMVLKSGGEFKVIQADLILSNGKVIAQGTPTQLMNNVAARSHYFGDSFKFN